MPAFILTEDNINGASTKENTVSPTNKIKQAYPKRFRLLDDDEIVYFYGRMKIQEHGVEVDEFLPLDRLGTGYGCTEIQVWSFDLNEWETVWLWNTKI